MSHGPEYYDWHGHPIEVDKYDATDGEPWDVSLQTAPAEHPTGMVPTGEVHYLCRLLSASGNRGFWATEEAFHEHAEPLATRAIGFDD